MSDEGTRLVLVAHGSRDARAARSTRGLARAVARRLAGDGTSGDGSSVEGSVPTSAATVAGPGPAMPGAGLALPVSPIPGGLAPAQGRRRLPRPRRPARPGTLAAGTLAAGSPVSAAFLDFSAPRLPDVLSAAAARGETTAIVVPLLLTAAYHGRVDVPADIERAVAAGARIDVGLGTVLGPVDGAVLDRRALDLMTAALIRRLDQTGALAGSDGILLAGAGSREDGALRTVDLVADALGTALGRPCRAGYASGSGPDTAAAFAALRADGARRIAVASYFLAPGLLHDRIVERARDAGAVGIAGPLGAAPEIARLVLLRAGAARVLDPVAA
ncbi:hypothetical protein GCM10023322_22750 [Rugosimonospora acidiphila]|uniref:Sirohydrochlorin ferrochelatase n=1 Tax=Rugosimonospora acidiphila TaxID=556531 RepID=A0ABP9RPG7_9ACTN